MPSLLPGYEYDIFISYRQKDNKGGKWVTNFVEALRSELEATFKEDLTIYFDENPHDGLLETHHVDKSLESKLKCLIFIPIVSQTYCDTKSFAWTEEFCAFNKLATGDLYGRDIKLSNGNVASRVLPVRIHSLDAGDQKSLETEIGSALRAVEFIYREPGVNRPLNPDDDASENLNKTRYRNQVNKVANAIKDIIVGLQNVGKHDFPVTEKSTDETLSNKKSIVVLPFENMSSDKNNEYFSDGLTGEIIADLSQTHALRVISRNSAMTFKGSHKKTKEIASELNVDYILEGSVRKSGNDLRITAQLVNANEDAPVWTERYVGDLQDIFAIQEKVSRAIVSALRLNLTTEESTKLGSKRFKDARSYELYQKALYEFYFFKDESLKRSITYLESALNFEGESSFLLTKLGFVYCNLFNFSAGLEDSSPYLTKAKRYADRIFQLEGPSTHWHSLMGFIGFYGGHISEVLGHLRSTKANSFETDDLWLVVLAYSYLGLMDKAQEHIEEMEQRDPLNPICPVLASLVCYMSQGSDKAYEGSKSAYARYPDIPQAQLYYAYHLAARESYSEAQAIVKKFIAGSADTIFAPIGALFLCGLERREPTAGLIPDDSAAKLRLDCEWSWLIADFYSFAGKKKESLDWLEHAVSHGFVNYPLLSTIDPYLKNIRNEERFKKILEVAKVGWEAAAREFRP